MLKSSVRNRTHLDGVFGADTQPIERPRIEEEDGDIRTIVEYTVNEDGKKVKVCLSASSTYWSIDRYL
jgi:hypothetical protein